MGLFFSRPPALGPDLANVNFDAQEQVLDIVRGNIGITSTSVATVGPVGVGKSSYLNTVASYTGSAHTLQAAAGSGSRSLTARDTCHTLIFEGQHATWNWIDTSGDAFDRLVHKFRCHRLPESWDEHIQIEEYEQHLHKTLLTPLHQRGVGCVVAMLSGKAIWHEARSAHPDKREHESLNVPRDSDIASQLQVLKHLHESLAHQGMRMICVLTHADCVDRYARANIKLLRYSWPLYRVRELVAKSIGLPENQVYHVSNMVREYRPQDNWELGYLALLPLQAAVRAARSAGHEAQRNRAADK